LPSGRDLAADAARALMLLTRLPLGWAGVNAPISARAVWAFPVVGGLVGGLGGGVFWLAAALGLPPWLSGAWALAGMLAITGALHEDGLADTADALGAEASPERRLAILRDSRIGTYGALALALALLIRLGALVAIGQPGAVMVALVVAGALGRAAMIGVPLLLAPARAEGLGAALGHPPMAVAMAGTGLALLLAFALLSPRRALAALLASGLALLAVSAFASRRLGGYTGDIHGAVEQVAECAVLSLLAAR